jgi:hypothetical protein
MKKILGITYSLAIVMSVAGCANGYRDFYKPAAGADPSQIAAMRLTPPPENPLVERIGHFDQTLFADAYMKRGYAIIGSSFFNSGRNEQDASAMQIGKEIKADLVVIVNPKYTGSVTTSMPIVTPTSSTTYSSGTATAYGSGGYATAYGTGTSTTYGSVTNYVPVTVNRMDYGAVYFVKPKIALGVLTRDLTDDERQTYQTNKGAVVRLVTDGTPAFYADVLVGDRILEIDGNQVANAQMYSQLIKERRGKSINLKIQRKDQIIEKQIQLLN